MFEFKLPDLGEGIHEGELLKWHVSVGETIAEDAPLVDVETDKAMVTIPSPRAGKVVELNGSEGDTLTVGNVIVRIDDGAGEEAAEAESSPAPDRSEQEAPDSPAPEAPDSSADDSPSSPSSQRAPEAPSAPAVRASGPVPAAPATRRLAREMGIDIALVSGSGPGGRVTRDDVKSFSGSGSTGSAAESRPAGAGASGGPIPYFELEPLPDFAAEGPVETEPVRSIRRKVARKMVTSMVVVPHVAHMDDADVTDLEAFRLAEREKRRDEPGGRLSLLPFVCKAVTEALSDFPMFNASLDPEREIIVYKKFYNIGFAADTPRGLIVPVIKDCDRKSILDVSAEILDLATKGRDGSIEAGALRGGTFTITNVGPIGGTNVIPTINYPEVAILGMGRAEDRAVVRDGEIVVRTILPLTLAFDHRVADGASAAKFMNALTRRLSSPLSWLLEKKG